jgi:hypothetical protein
MPENTPPPDFERDRARAEALLPWAANGTLDPAERAWLDAWLAAAERSDPDVASRMRAEVAWLQRTADQHHAQIHLPDPAHGLDTLFGRIAAEQPRVRMAPTSLFARWTDGLRAWTSGHGLQLAGACAALALTTALTLTLAPREGSDLVILDGGTGVLVVPGTSLLKVAFAAQASERDIREALQAADARIVDGPNALGLYVLRVPSAGRDAALAALRARSAVVESAELAEAGSP